MYSGYLSGVGQGYQPLSASPQMLSAGPQAAPQMGGAPAQQAATPAAPPAGMAQGPTGTPGFGLNSQLAALPSWAQGYAQSQTQGLDTRGLENFNTNLVGQYQGAVKQYGADAAYNPYFNNYAQQGLTPGANFNPFNSNLQQGASIDQFGNISKGGTQNPFTGAYMGNGGGTLNLPGMEGGYLKGEASATGWSAPESQVGMYTTLWNWYKQAREYMPGLTFQDVAHYYNTNVANGVQGF